MTNHDQPSGPLHRKTRLPFEQRAGTLQAGPARRGSIILYGLLVVALVGVAVYMRVLVGHPLDSPYVAAPAVGALWFGLRLFMSLAPRM
jgi:hypothetical protein